MRATVATTRSRTVLRITPGSPIRPRKTSTERVRRYQARMIAAGRCRQCGRRRTRFAQRCGTCQKKERIRWREAYGNNWGWFDARREQYRQRARIAHYIARLEAGA
jgi:hypothetical protein